MFFKNIKPKVGETLFLVVLPRWSNDKTITETVIVTKVGRKYFSIKRDSNIEIEFYIETWKENNHYSSYNELYKSEQKYLEKLELDEYITLFKNTFDYSRFKNNFTIQQLKEAAKILGINIEKITDVIF